MNAAQGHDLMTRLGLTAKDTSTALALFYVSYVIFDFPSNLVMSRLSPRVWMARIVIATGTIGACFAAVQSAWSVKYVRPSRRAWVENPPPVQVSPAESRADRPVPSPRPVPPLNDRPRVRHRSR